VPARDRAACQLSGAALRYSDVVFSGKSGAIYRFQVWSLETVFRPVPAAYIVTRREQSNGTYNNASHEVLYIGETSSLADPFATAADFSCFRKHGATCICIYRVDHEQLRREAALDLALAHSTLCGEKSKLDRLSAASVPAEAERTADGA
jgi:hypothetical protein